MAGLLSTATNKLPIKPTLKPTGVPLGAGGPNGPANPYGVTNKKATPPGQKPVVDGVYGAGGPALGAGGPNGPVNPYAGTGGLDPNPNYTGTGGLDPNPNKWAPGSFALGPDDTPVFGAKPWDVYGTGGSRPAGTTPGSSGNSNSLADIYKGPIPQQYQTFGGPPLGAGGPNGPVRPGGQTGGLDPNPNGGIDFAGGTVNFNEQTGQYTPGTPKPRPGGGVNFAGGSGSFNEQTGQYTGGLPLGAGGPNGPVNPGGTGGTPLGAGGPNGPVRPGDTDKKAPPGVQKPGSGIDFAGGTRDFNERGGPIYATKPPPQPRPDGTPVIKPPVQSANPQPRPDGTPVIKPPTQPAAPPRPDGTPVIKPPTTTQPTTPGPTGNGLLSTARPDVQTKGPVQRTVDAATETVEGRIGNLTKTDAKGNYTNPVLQQAAQQMQQQFAGRGLLNSSAAQQAAYQAALSQATNIAGADANIYSKQALANQDAANTFNLADNQFGYDIAKQREGQNWQSNENTTQRNWQSGENQLTREQQTNLQNDQQDFTKGENDTQRGWQSGENAANRNWQSSENNSQRSWQSGENAAQRSLQQFLQTNQQAWQGDQNAMNRDLQKWVQENQQLWQGDQNAMNRDLQKYLQESQQNWGSSENQLNRDQQTMLQGMQQNWNSAENQKNRDSSFKLAELQAQNSMAQAQLSANTQKEIAQLNRDYQQMANMSATAATLYLSFNNEVANISMSDMTTEAKEKLIKQAMDRMQAGMKLQGAFNGGLDLEDLFKQLYPTA